MGRPLHVSAPIGLLPWACTFPTLSEESHRVLQNSLLFSDVPPLSVISLNHYSQVERLIWEDILILFAPNRLFLSFKKPAFQKLLGCVLLSQGLDNRLEKMLE